MLKESISFILKKQLLPLQNEVCSGDCKKNVNQILTFSWILVISKLSLFSCEEETGWLTKYCSHLEKDIDKTFPRWKNMAAMLWSCHDHIMIMAKHDHAMMTAWQPCLLEWSPWFMTWSWYDYQFFHDSYHDNGMIITFSAYEKMGF